jgi:hypothetical protein
VIQEGVEGGAEQLGAGSLPGVIKSVGGPGQIEEKVGDAEPGELGGESATLQFPHKDVAPTVYEQSGWTAGMGEVDAGSGAIVFGGFFGCAAEVLAK